MNGCRARRSSTLRPWFSRDRVRARAEACHRHAAYLHSIHNGVWTRPEVPSGGLLHRSTAPKRSDPGLLFARIDLGLSIKRNVVGVLGCDHMGQRTGAGNALIYRSRRRRSLHDRAATCAAELGTNVTDHYEACRHVLEHLGNIFAQLSQLAAAVRAVPVFRKMSTNLAPKMRRKCTALASRRGPLAFGNIRPGWLFRHIARVIFSIETEFQLRVTGRSLFRARTKMRSLELEDPQLQIRDAIPASGDRFAKRRVIHLFQISVAIDARNHKRSMPRCISYGAKKMSD